MSPEELFDQNWSDSEFTFDFSDFESDYDGISLPKNKVILITAPGTVLFLAEKY